MSHTAKEEHGFAPTDLKSHQRVNVGPENHPDGPCPANTERKCDPFINPLGEQPITENGADCWGQGEDSRGRYRRGRLEPLEHQNKVSAHQAAQQQVAPGRLKIPTGNPATSPRPDRHDHRSEHKAQRRQRSRSDVIGNNVAETKRARDHGREK